MIRTSISTDLPRRTLAETSRTGAADIEIAIADGLTARQKELFITPHRKDFYLIGIVASAESRHWVDMIPYSLQPGCVYFTAPHQVILKEGGSMRGMSVCFTQEFLDLEDPVFFSALPLIHNLRNAHELRPEPGDFAFINDIALKMLAEQERPASFRNSMLLAYLRVLLIRLSRIYTEQYPVGVAGQGYDLLRTYQGLVNERFKTCHEVGAYASMMSLSAGHLGELVRQQSGRTPSEHIHERLLIEAKRLLFHTELSAKEIGFELGFSEASYFNRFFKRLSGTTPMDYRKLIREKYQ